MSLSPEQLLEWAGKVEEASIVDEVESMIEALKRAPTPDYFTPQIYTQPRPLVVDCGCPSYGICMSTACPRAIRFTNQLNGASA